MKIDIYTHVMPERYKKALYKYADKFATEKAVQDRRPALTDHERRLRILEEFPDVVEVLSATMPPGRGGRGSPGSGGAGEDL